MFETLAAVAIAAGFVTLVRLIAGPDDESTLLRMFVSAPMPARPRGVQETDLAPFKFRDPDPEPATAARIRRLGARPDAARAA
jgi:hypothetical protein